MLGNIYHLRIEKCYLDNERLMCWQAWALPSLSVNVTENVDGMGHVTVPVAVYD